MDFKQPLLSVTPPDDKDMNLINDEVPIMRDWLSKVKGYRTMYASATLFYSVMTAMIDIPLIIIPIICSTFNMQSDQFGTLGYYILNGLIALIPILHGIQKYFAFNESLSSLKRARALFDAMAYDIQLFIVQMKHLKEEEITQFMDDIEQKIVSGSEIENVPYWIKRKYDPDLKTTPDSIPPKTPSSRR